MDNSNNAELLNLKNKNNALLNENNQLKTEISNLKSKINSLNNTIAQLKQTNTELNNLKLKYENDINQLKSEKSDLLNKLKNIKEKNNSISNIKSSSYEINELVSALMDKDKEIKKLNKAFPFEIKDGDQLLTVIFVSEDKKIHYSFICNDSEKFNNVENRLYEIYPEYEGENNTFIVRGNKIRKNRTLKENNIKYSDIIMLIPIED